MHQLRFKLQLTSVSSIRIKKSVSLLIMFSFTPQRSFPFDRSPGNFRGSQNSQEDNDNRVILTFIFQIQYVSDFRFFNFCNKLWVFLRISEIKVLYLHDFHPTFSASHISLPTPLPLRFMIPSSMNISYVYVYITHVTV